MKPRKQEKPHLLRKRRLRLKKLNKLKPKRKPKRLKEVLSLRKLPKKKLQGLKLKKKPRKKENPFLKRRRREKREKKRGRKKVTSRDRMLETEERRTNTSGLRLCRKELSTSPFPTE